MSLRTSAGCRASASAAPETVRGIFLMCAGVAMFPLMNAMMKLLTARYPVFEIVWARLLVIFLPRYGRRLIATRRPLVQFGRSALMLASNAVFVLAIGKVPLATASAIGFTSPLIVTGLSVPLLREQVGWRRWSAVCVGFVGALLIIKPGTGLHNPAVLLLLVSALAYALYQIATRWVMAHDSPATGIIFAALLGSLATTLLLPFVWVMPNSLAELAMLLALGGLGGLGHFLVIKAFQAAPASVVAPLGYVELIGTATLGYLIFASFPDALTWVGALIIIASGLYIAMRERKRLGIR
jgi:drug/metabolite transporter (DMT)-like permease